MGASNSQLSFIRPFNQEEWQPAPLIPYTNIKDPLYASNFRVLVNKLNATLQVEKYDLYFNSYKQYSKYRKFIDWRNGNRFTVQVRYVSEPQRQNVCSSFYQGSIYIERLPIRLVQIDDISIQEGLCILITASQGFQRLYQKYGYFQIEPELICFTREGFIKVWINKNLSKIMPQAILHQNRKENFGFFIQRLIVIVQGLIDFEGKHSISTFIQLKELQRPYDNMYNTLELYAKYMKVKIPRYLTTIRKICERDMQIKNLIPKRRSCVASQKFGNNIHYQNSSKASKNRQLQIDQQVVNIAIKSLLKKDNSTVNQSCDIPLQKNHCQSIVNSCNTSKVLTVRFSYKANNQLFTSIPLSKQMPKDQLSIFTRKGAFDSSASSQVTNQNQSNNFMDKKKPRYLSLFESQEELDMPVNNKRFFRY